jgi:LPXTG-motif cell wall-anchored protein
LSSPAVPAQRFCICLVCVAIASSCTAGVGVAGPTSDSVSRSVEAGAPGDGLAGDQGSASTVREAESARPAQQEEQPPAADDLRRSEPAAPHARGGADGSAPAAPFGPATTADPRELAPEPLDPPPAPDGGAPRASGEGSRLQPLQARPEPADEPPPANPFVAPVATVSWRAGPHSPRAGSSSHGGFGECHGVPDTGACERELSGLFEEEQAACLRGETEACQDARRDFELRRVCIDEPDPRACAAAVGRSTCFTDPRSNVCRTFVGRRAPLCRPIAGSFACEVLRVADFLSCSARGLSGCGGGAGGSQEEESPHGRADPSAAGGGETIRVGLTDPGARGDAGLRQISASAGDRSANRKTNKLPQTGFDSWLVGVLGLLILGFGLYARRFVPD